MSQMRFLLYISYIGTRFRGYQIQMKASQEISSFQTVQGVIRKAFLDVLSPTNGVPPFDIYTSSRTDVGVHAIRNAVLMIFHEGYQIPRTLFQSVNKIFKSQNLEICINEVIPVTEKFHCRRSALARTYVYRFGVGPAYLKPHPGPISERNRAYIFHSNNFDIRRAQEAIPLFLGSRDYGAFVSMKYIKKYPLRSTVRKLTELELKPVPPLMLSHDPYVQEYNFYEIKFTARSYLVHMVRRITSLIIAVGCQNIKLDLIRFLFDNPVPSSWNSRVNLISGEGLYLVNVSFNEEHFIYPEISDAESDAELL